MADSGRDAAEAFIARWKGVAASELSTSQSFLIGLCELLGVEAPHATPAQDYMFERPIKFAHGDGSSSDGRIDLYRRGAFVLESKKLKAGSHTRGFDDALLRARSQAENYARALPSTEGRPPFVVVVDVGNRIELYSEFSRSGATYTPFPDPRSHRIGLADLQSAEVRERLRRVWMDPLSLDPSRESAEVTRKIARQLATLARSLEHSGHQPEAVAQFLMRCLFTMFAEDVKLLPQDSFRELLNQYAGQPDVAMRMLGQLWRDMDTGGFSAVIAGNVLQFNGKLFKQPDTLPLDRAQIDLLVDAARADWKHVEPAIFGTLLERALSPGERHKLGAHYTPRAYVERLVLPTVIEPLRAEWSNAQAAALVLAAEGSVDKAASELRRFHHRLCTVRVLDPACGSGNFLYVTLEHLKRLEGEVLNALDELGDRQTGLALGSERADAAGGETVDPHNLLGIELNPRAAAIAEVVLWIGYLQWHFRTRGDVFPPQPVIRDFHNIENRDAVLAYDHMEYVLDERGLAVTRWDGRTMKVSPVTGEDVPDDSARVPVERYVNPRKAAWPTADFVVGNPPFIGNKRMRTVLGDGYVEALRGAWTDVPESADFVMYWWHHAAQLTRRGALQRFGLITTNSISQTFSRRVIEAAMLPPKAGASGPFPRLRGKAGMGARPEPNDVPTSAPPPQPSPASGGGSKEQPLSLVFAIPDHPWVDSAEGAAVRIAMTVGSKAQRDGILMRLDTESEGADGEVSVDLAKVVGVIHSDLSVGADITQATRLAANRGLACPGVQLSGQGFVLQPVDLVRFSPDSQSSLIRPYITGRDLTQKPRTQYVIDTFGFDERRLRDSYPDVYQHLVHHVLPDRQGVSTASKDVAKYAEQWWLHSKSRPKFRPALVGLIRCVVTSRTARYRTFGFVDTNTLPETKVLVFAFDDAAMLGFFSSAVHTTFAEAAGGSHGVGNDLTYNHSDCFEKFPFPSASDELQSRVRTLAEQLDAHRKRQQAAHADLTLTGMYNVLDKLRSGEVLNAKERIIHEQGLVSVLRQLHDELDAAVLEAYGWSDLLPLLRIAHGNDAPADGHTRDEAKRGFDESILERLVALNAERAAEEARGLVRWLRPEFQSPDHATGDAGQDDLAVDSPQDIAPASATLAIKPQAWPKDAVDQVRAVADLLAASAVPLSEDEIAARFTARGAWKKRLPQLLQMLVALGRAQQQECDRYVTSR